MHEFLEAVRRVLPAVNIRPESLTLDRGAVRRARQRPPWMRALSGTRQLLVYIGALGPENRADAVPLALTALSDGLRRECEQLVVVWDDPAGGSYAVACSLTEDHEPGPLLGRSWIDPKSWRDPMIDASRPLDTVLTEALADVRRVVTAGPPGPDFGDALQRALTLVDVALRTAGGERQFVPAESRPAGPRTPSPWLTRYELSVRDEWNRIRGTLAATRIRAARPTASGPLSGRRVFLSYARPDAADLARPVLEALREQGADVWFDQEESLEDGWLDRGLAATIEGCDAYLLCASDELFERAGYATQEVAWALRSLAGDSPLRAAAVVARRGTVLPAPIKPWPVAVVSPDGHPDLGPGLARDLRAGRPRPGRRVDRPVAPAPVPDPVVDRQVLIDRVRHRERLHETPNDEIMRVAAGDERDARSRAIVDRVRRVGDGLGWDGHVTGLDGWPVDPVIRGYRWMLGTSRALAGVRWPLSDDLEVLDDASADIQLLVTRPLPMLEWPAAAGWGDEERRLLVRFHAGALRTLEELLERGLWGGLADTGSPVLDRWAVMARERRQESVDALLDLRLADALSWRGDPPLWEDLYRDWSRALTRGPVLAGVPGPVRLPITGDLTALAALAAQVTWQASRSPGRVVQSFDGGLAAHPIRYTAGVARHGDGGCTSGVNPGGRRLDLGLVQNAAHGWTVRTSWSGFPAAAGSAEVPAPVPLSQSVSFASA